MCVNFLNIQHLNFIVCDHSSENITITPQVICISNCLHISNMTLIIYILIIYFNISWINIHQVIDQHKFLSQYIMHQYIATDFYRIFHQWSVSNQKIKWKSTEPNSTSMRKSHMNQSQIIVEVHLVNLHYPNSKPDITLKIWQTLDYVNS